MENELLENSNFIMYTTEDENYGLHKKLWQNYLTQQNKIH